MGCGISGASKVYAAGTWETCGCGADFAPGAAFCDACGALRPPKEGAAGPWAPRKGGAVNGEAPKQPSKPEDKGGDKAKKDADNEPSDEDSTGSPRLGENLETQQAETLIALSQLDSQTRVPHLLVELRSSGYVQVNGKNFGGIFQQLAKFLSEEIGFEKSDPSWRKAAAASSDGRFTSLRVGADGKTTSIFRLKASTGESNMGLVAISVIEFLTGRCGWSLQFADGGSTGAQCHIREQRLLFRKATYSQSHIVCTPHLIVELHESGRVAACGAMFAELENWLRRTWRAKRADEDPYMYEHYYKCSNFKRQGTESNLPMRAAELLNVMVGQFAWTLVSCQAGNAGSKGTQREQRLVFREGAQTQLRQTAVAGVAQLVQRGAQDHILVELRDEGSICVSGLPEDDEVMSIALDNFMKEGWECRPHQAGFWESSRTLCDLKYDTPADFYMRKGLISNLGMRAFELADFMATRGWALATCSPGYVPDKKPGKFVKREQQITFVRSHVEEAEAPLLMIVLRTLPTKLGDYRGFIELIGDDTNGVYQRLIPFMQQAMLAEVMEPQPFCDLLLACDCFRLHDDEEASRKGQRAKSGRLCGESNLGRYAVRICDLLVDHSGDWELVASSGSGVTKIFDLENLVDEDDDEDEQDPYLSQEKFEPVVFAREHQILFRHVPSRAAEARAKAAAAVPKHAQPTASPLAPLVKTPPPAAAAAEAAPEAGQEEATAAQGEPATEREAAAPQAASTPAPRPPRPGDGPGSATAATRRSPQFGDSPEEAAPPPQYLKSGFNFKLPSFEVADTEAPVNDLVRGREAAAAPAGPIGMKVPDSPMSLA